MILVLGSVIVRQGRYEEALSLSLEHVARSRKEPGCVAHSVHQDAENPLRLVFAEQWSDMTVLRAHFKVPESREFAKAIGALASAPPEIAIYDAKRVGP